ncbi:hypothetical protein Tco_1195641 [Tanacetum coccineum]
MTKVIKGEFEKIKDIKVLEDDSLACRFTLEFFQLQNNGSLLLGKAYGFIGSEEMMSELTDEEFSDNEDEIAEVFRIDTNIFDYETHILFRHSRFKYHIMVDPTYLQRILWGLKPMMIIKTTGTTNGIRLYHRLMRNDGLTLEFG